MADAQWVRDLDGDGLDEAAVAVIDADCQGRVFLFYGRAGGLTGVVDLATADAVFEGVGGPNLSGTRIMGGSDLDGDGFNDLLIGDVYQQRISFFHGGARYAGKYDAKQATATFLSISGGSYVADVGCSIALPGDLDGDGFEDLVIGQPGFDNCRGRILIFRGGRPFEDQVDLEKADGVLEGEIAGDLAGSVVGGVGDPDGDGLADFVVSAPSTDPEGHGVLYLYYGKDGGFPGAGNLKDAPVRFTSAINQQRMQTSAGDFDGDGRQDFALGFPCQKLAVVLYGSATRLSGARLLEQVVGTYIQSSDGSTHYSGSIEDAGFGSSVGLGGDFNGDGMSDLVVASATSHFGVGVSSDGTVVYTYDPGYVAIFPGRADRPSSLRAGYSTSVLIEGADGLMETVYPVSAGADFNGDGLDDLLVGSDIDAGGTASSSRTFLFTPFKL
jgi:hypothetical protein